MTKREEEKMRLWDEVMNKKRPTTEEEINLELETSEPETKEDNVVLRSANDALASLNKILLKQQEELTKMEEEIKKPREFKTIDKDMDDMSKGLQSDYKVREKQETKKEIDSAKVFSEIASELKNNIIGQDEALNALVSAFRRPYVMGINENEAKNVILVLGPEGSGRHQAIVSMARALYKRQIFLSDEVYDIDMSRYTSASQEQIFLQDLYQALNGQGGILCFTNFEAGFPSFLRMVAQLATDNTVLLNKRYVFNKGILVENQTGLVTSSIDRLSASGKYLVFITDGKIADVQDAFGADFMYHVLDTITFTKMDEVAIATIINHKLKDLEDNCLNKLKLNLTIEDSLKSWVMTHYDKNRGVTEINDYFEDFFISLSEIRLQNEQITNVTINANDEPKAIYDGGEKLLSRSRNSQAELAEVQKELDAIVGLSNVKDYISSLQAHMKVQQRRKEQGLKVAEVSKHMVFTGNPGTGKTTIARLLSRYMKAIGALSGGQLVEVTRADLVAQYVGQTAPLTMQVIKSALGGVLFIDEAYSLYRGKEDSFGLEAIDTLVKGMEDNRDDLIVILAGYSKEMSVFLESNSGLRSRFPNFIDFPDYTGEELLKIADIQAKSKGYYISEDAKEPLQAYFTHVQATNAAQAGNGRLARNVIEDAILAQAKRLASNPEAKIDELQLIDFDIKTNGN